MRNKFIILVLFCNCLFAESYANNREHNIKESMEVMDCSGNFMIDGKSYTITLHDQSLWTCAKFKIGSWFQ